MNFKILVLASLVVAATMADDTFLMDSDFQRYLANNFTNAITATACTADSACTTLTGVSYLPACCAKWWRSTTTTSMGSYCTPTSLLGASFFFNSVNYSISTCASTTTATGTACTANSLCTATNTSTCCLSLSWDNSTAGAWTNKTTLGSYCGANQTYSTVHGY